MTQEQVDPVIDEIREIRQRISAGFDYDTARMVAYYMELQVRIKDWRIDLPKSSELGDLNETLPDPVGM